MTHTSAANPSSPKPHERRARTWRSRLLGALLVAALSLCSASARAEESTPVAPSSTASPGSSSTPPPLEKPWFADVYERSRASVVVVESGAGRGSGFVFHSSRHIGTAFHVIARGRPVSVRFLGGRVLPAEVVAVDPEGDVAILELPEPACPSPLMASSEAATMGTPVMVIGHTGGPVEAKEHEGLFEWNLSHGMVLRQGGRRIQMDAVLHHGNSGGPVIGRDGRVIGVGVSGIAEQFYLASPIAKLEALTHEIGRQGTFRGRLIPGLWAGGQMQERADDWLLGVEGGARALLHDRWIASLRLSLLWSAQAGAPPAVLSRHIFRFSGELAVGHRWLLWPRYGFYAGLAAGGALALDRLDDTTATLGTAGTGAPQIVEQRGVSLRKAAQPLIELDMESGRFLGSYGVLFDVKDPGALMQRAAFGYFF